MGRARGELRARRGIALRRGAGDVLAVEGVAVHRPDGQPLLAHRPAWLFLDEATSAVDADLERQLYRALRERLPRTTIVSIGHRRGLAEYHARTVELGTGGAERELRRA